MLLNTLFLHGVGRIKLPHHMKLEEVNNDKDFYVNSNKSSWSGFLGKDDLHPNKSGDLRLANYFYGFLKKCISSDNASQKRKNYQSITPDTFWILWSLSSCDQPLFLSS
ncbi:uncharacterized protein LOC129981379 [Argiope bruennichi]|uniref:uncharacterized protein LOC129981379 n=1 Tax=Argiope bruennichi TaxID=94029 RepID=UPI002494EF50|nr:uncharacterized protein LOC129981379 [Argiope bruennichi]